MVDWIDEWRPCEDREDFVGFIHKHVESHLNLGEQIRDLRQDLVPAQHAAADVHELRNSFAITDELVQLARDQRCCLGVVQAESSRQPFLLQPEIVIVIINSI